MNAPTGPFEYVASIEHFANSLGATVTDLRDTRRMILHRKAYKYRTIRVHGKSRQLAVPNVAVGNIQQRIAAFLWPLALSLTSHCHGYVPDRSTVTNTFPHCGMSWVQRLDVADFYPSTNHQLITKALVNWGASADVASIISDLTTDQGFLPLGTPTSPILSNLILHPVDVEIGKHCVTLGINYTRYADDLTFSSPTPFDCSPQVAEALRPLGYRINAEKSSLRKKGQSIRVTGLTVAERDWPRLPKRFKRTLRQELYFVERYGLAEHALHRYYWPWIGDEDVQRHVAHSQNHLQGRIHYALGIEPQWTRRLLDGFPKASSTLAAENSLGSEERSKAIRSLVYRIRHSPRIRLDSEFRQLA